MRWRGGAPHPHVRSQEWLCFYARVRGGTLCWVLELCGNPSCVSTAVTEVTCSRQSAVGPGDKDRCRNVGEREVLVENTWGAEIGEGYSQSPLCIQNPKLIFIKDFSWL